MAKRERPEIDVQQGRLVGRWKAKGSVAVFRGVPFAAPPVGDRRWRPPAPAEPWSGTREAAKDGPTAIQRAADLNLFLHHLLHGQGWSTARANVLEALVPRLPRPAESEDCLYLTVRTPSPGPGAKLPVMVWIHGGDHQDGSGADVYYAANALAGHGVVTVSINYRLGVLGFLAHPGLSEESEEGVSGNYGSLDQIAALEWVRDNIEAFGGDPDRVTVFGESAGGESVLHLMTSPLARGLFHQAVAQSPANGGQMIHLDQPFLAYDSGHDLGLRFAQAVGVGSGPGAGAGSEPGSGSGSGAGSAAEQVARLRALSADQLYEVARADREVGNHYPVIDGHVLPESPLAAFAGGRQAAVPLVIGSNADEGTLIQPLFGAPMPEYRYRPLPEGSLQAETAEAFGADMDRLLALYPGLDRRDPKAEIDFVGDHMFGARAYHYARHHRGAGHQAHLYLFARVPKGAKQTAGAFHAAELPFVHGSRVPIFPMTAADKALSVEMMRYWTDFAHTGDPNGSGAGAGGAGSGGAGAGAGAGHPEWPRFEADDPRWMRFNHTITVEPVGRREQYEIFNARTDRLVAEMATLAG